MGLFSEKTNSKLYRSHRKAVNNRFDSLGGKVKELSLHPEKEATVLGILEEEYKAQMNKLHQQNQDGTLPPLSKEQEDEAGSADPGEDNTGDDLNAMLNLPAKSAEPAPTTAPVAPAKPAAPAKTKTGNKKK